MAIAIKTTEKAARQDTYRVAPQDVTPGRNSRIIAAPNYLDIVQKLAVSIAKHGQLAPAEVRRVEGNALEVVDGHTRHDAVIALREGFDAIDPDSGETVRFHDPARLLWVKVTDLSADEAFLHSIKANQDREGTTDLQEALAQSELRTTLGWTDSKIARFYNYTNQNRVAALSKLLCCPKEIQNAVHEGRLALSNAILTLDSGLTPEEQLKLVEEASTDGKVSGPALKKLLRDLLAASEPGVAPAPVDPVDPAPLDPTDIPPEPSDDVETEEPSGGKVKVKAIKRTAKDFERWLAENTSDDTKLNDGGAELAKVLLLWFKGQRNDEYLRVKFLEYCVNKV